MMPPVSAHEFDITQTKEFKEATRLYSAGNKQKALSILRTLETKYPRDVELRLSIGSLLKMSGDRPAALAELRKGIELDKSSKHKSSDLHTVYGKMLSEDGKVDEAITEYNTAVDIDPTNGYAHFYKAESYSTGLDPAYCALAIKDLDAAEKFHVKDYRLQLLKGLCLIESGRPTEGVKVLKSAIPATTSNSESKVWLDHCREKIAEVEQAQKNPPTPPVQVEKRKYVMKPGTAAVVVSVDNERKIIKYAINGRHDPDGGAQDGVDDGIVEGPMDGFGVPDKIYRSKNAQ